MTGDPILHSLSPALHRAGLSALGLPGASLRLAAPDAASALRMARRLGLRGLNVTAPFKEGMAALLDTLEGPAATLGAVNTVCLGGSGRPTGFNSDVAGVAGALRELGAPALGERAVVLGAGGAAKAAVLALQEAGAEVVIANRSPARAQLVAGRLGCRAVGLEPEVLRGLLEEARILVNATGAAETLLPAALLHPRLRVLEAVYGRETALLRDARGRGCRVAEGQRWLLHQGACALGHLLGRSVPLAALEGALDARPAVLMERPVALVGFMGAGKSATALALGRITGLPVLDLDARISARAGRSIPQIFRSLGEAAFRDLESEALREALAAAEPGVLACGGGILERESNRRLLGERALVVWLWADPDTLRARAGRSPGRPLLEVTDPWAALLRLLAARTPRYAAAADLVLDASETDPETLGRRIAREVG